MQTVWPEGWITHAMWSQARALNKHYHAILWDAPAHPLQPCAHCAITWATKYRRLDSTAGPKAEWLCQVCSKQHLLEEVITKEYKVLITPDMHVEMIDPLPNLKYVQEQSCHIKWRPGRQITIQWRPVPWPCDSEMHMRVEGVGLITAQGTTLEESVVASYYARTRQWHPFSTIKVLSILANPTNQREINHSRKRAAFATHPPRWQENVAAVQSQENVQ